MNCILIRVFSLVFEHSLANFQCLAGEELVQVKTCSFDLISLVFCVLNFSVTYSFANIQC